MNGIFRKVLCVHKRRIRIGGAEHGKFGTLLKSQILNNNLPSRGSHAGAKALVPYGKRYRDPSPNPKVPEGIGKVWCEKREKKKRKNVLTAPKK